MHQSHVGTKMNSYHHGRIMRFLESPAKERKYACLDPAEAEVMVHSLLRLRRLYGYEIVISQEGRDVWVCKPGSPRTMPGMIPLTQLGAEIGLSKSTISYRMQTCKIIPARSGNKAYVTPAEADAIRGFLERRKG